MRLVACVLLTLTACASAGGKGALAPNQIEVLGLDEPQADKRVQILIDEAQDWYALYLQSANPALWQRHAAAAEGARQLRAAAPLPPVPMPTLLEDDELLMPYGRG